MQSSSPISAPAAGKGNRAALASLMARMALLAAGVDAIYLVFFLAIGSQLLGWMNLVSIAMYFSAYALVRHRRLRSAAILMWTEAILHGIVASLLLGWESGFHYVLLMTIPAVIIGSPRRLAVLIILGIVAYLGALDAISRYWGPLAPIPDTALLVVKWINLCIFIAMFSALASYYRNKIDQAERHLQALATIDALTGLHNRRHLEMVAEQEIARIRRKGVTCALAVTDIDFFKKINDTQGHDAGDRVLVHIGQLLKAGLRESDTLARWGGEEFVLLMPDTDLANAMAIAERIRLAVENSTVDFPSGEIRCTLSFGLAQILPGDSLADAFSRADAALYRSKSEGRNRVSVDTTA